MQKKITLSILIPLFSLLIFSSCSLFGGNDDEANTNNNSQPGLITKQGIIRSQEIYLDTPGTHKLEIKSKEILLLESKTLALSDYLDQKVIVEGVLFVKNNIEVLDVSKVSLQTSNSNTNEHIIELLQYSGPLGVTFQYSSLFLLSSPTQNEINMSIADQTMDINNKEYPVITISILEETPDDLTEWITGTLSKESVTIAVGNTNGERLINTENKNATIYVLLDKLYQISFTAPGGKDEDKIKNKFYEMLNSFIWEITEPTNENENISSDTETVNTNSSTIEVANENTNTITTIENKNENITPPVNDNQNYYTEEVTTEPTNNEKGNIISYINKNLNNLKPEDEAITATVTATKYEFAENSYLYVEYTDGTNKRKLLLKYYNESGEIKVSQIAYFVPGETKSWDIKTGENEAAATAREVYDDSGEKKAEVSSEMRLYEQASLDYSIQYPKNWYYAGSAAEESGAIHQVNFSDEPLDSSSGATIKMTVFKGTLSSLGVSNTTVYEDNKVTIYVEKNDRVYKITAPSSQESTAKAMSQTVISQ